MQILKFWGVKGGKFQFLLTKPYKECESHSNASFKPLTVIIGPTGGPVAMSMKLKKPKLETWGRAQHEAARRPMSDLKYILGSCKVC